MLNKFFNNVIWNISDVFLIISIVCFLKLQATELERVIHRIKHTNEISIFGTARDGEGCKSQRLSNTFF